MFADTVATQKTMSTAPLNMFIERNAIELWCRKLNLKLIEVIGGQETRWQTGPLAQAVAILEKSSA